MIGRAIEAAKRVGKAHWHLRPSALRLSRVPAWLVERGIDSISLIAVHSFSDGARFWFSQ
jgi:hypothetical protein